MRITSGRSVFWPVQAVFLLLFSFESVLAQTKGSKPEIQPAPSPLNQGSHSGISRENHITTNIELRDDVIRIATRMVITEVMVFDSNGRPVHGLDKSQFEVFENDELQSIETFDRGGEFKSIPRSFILIIDYSESQLPYISTSVDAAKQLVDKLAAFDSMTILTDDVERLVGPTSDKGLLKESLEMLKQRALSGKTGKSSQYRALMKALLEIDEKSENRPVVIFQTDGDELTRVSRKDINPMLAVNLREAFDIEDFIAAAKKRGVSVYSIIPGMRFDGLSDKERYEIALIDRQNIRAAAVKSNRSSPLVKDEKLNSRYVKAWAEARARDALGVERLSKTTGGWVEFLERPDQAADVYSRLFSLIDSRYLICYYPAREVVDGKPREVEVTVKGHPEYKVKGSKTYIASNEGP